MPGLLQFEDEHPFATGATKYFTGASGMVTEGRLLVRIALEGQNTIAAVDTGAPYLVCEPELAQLLEPFLVDPLENTSLVIRGIRYSGTLYLLTVQLMASYGESIAVPATVFIPTMPEGQTWPWPTFLGWAGMLERMRFAIDPEASLFYFGPLVES